jgi:hypothetical protein
VDSQTFLGGPVPALHAELVGSVIAINDRGYLVRLPDGLVGSVDQTKTRAWGSDRSPQIGEELTVVVLDDDRTPYRLSALPTDIEIARRTRNVPAG